MKPTLYLIRGVSGAGKSSFAHTLWAAGVVDKIYEADDWFYVNGDYEFKASELSYAHKQCQRNTRFTLVFGKSVAVSNTSTTEREVEVYKSIADECGAHFVSIIMENRHDGVNIHGVPEDKLNQMKERFSVRL